MGSTIHPEHLGIFHQGPHDALLNYWQQSGANVNIKEQMDYDPYLGRIVESSAAQQENS